MFALFQKEREHYEFVVVDGKILHKLSGKPLDTNGGSAGSKWIFVMSTTKRLYTGEVRSDRLSTMHVQSIFLPPISYF